jgi:COMPASS component SWD2
MVFVVASQSVQTISFYDVKSYDRAPFLSVPFAGTPQGVDWTSVEFSNQGKYVLLSTTGDTHYLFDGYNVTLLAKLRGHAPLARHRRGPTKHTAFTVDGRYVFGGSGDSKVHIWDLTALPEPGGTLLPAASLPCKRMPEVLGFSTKTMLLATAERELTLWLPEKN